MATSTRNRTTAISREPMFNLAQEMNIFNFSQKTIKAYLYYNKEFLRFANKFSDDINKQDIKDYLEYLYRGGRSTATINLVINSLKFYYSKIMRRNFFSENFGIKRPKKEKNPPAILSKQEIAGMINASHNLKHKIIVQVLHTSVCGFQNLEIC